MQIKPNDLARFNSKFLKGAISECWEWSAALVKGYGVFWIEYKNHYAHRVSWVVLNGPILDGLCILHKCDNPKCVNPNHLFVGSCKDNMRDMISKGRKRVVSADEHWTRKHPEKIKRGDQSFSRQNPHKLCRGSKHGRSLLKEGDIPKIFESRDQGLSYSQIAERFSVKPATIGCIIRGRNWKHLSHSSTPSPVI